jgi:hypothetical protein
MNEKNIKTLLHNTAEEEIPSAEVSLWPSIKQHLVEKGGSLNRQPTHVRRLRAVAYATLVVLVGIIAGLATPQGRSLAQEILQFFTRSDSDTLPVQSWQLTPLPEITTPDPGDINNATLSVSEVEGQLGYDVLEPSWLPEVLTFAGANLEPEQQIAKLFYRYEETNGLVLSEQPGQIANECELCGSVGASAYVETVQIGNTTGEYVEGVWTLTEEGPVWVSDPYLKRLRWQANGMAFELLYMGPPDSLSRVDLITIAESLK